MEAFKESRLNANEGQTVRKQGGWLTFPFLAGNMLGLGVAMGGATSNIIVYLIKEYNVKSIDAAQISNIINGCTSLAPVAGAIISDAYFGSFPVVAVSTFVSLLSTILFTVTATVRSLRPSPCPLGSDATCEPPSAGQLAVLYTAVGLVAVGAGGTRFNTMTFGANQFDKVGDQEIFFNWYFIIMYASSIIGATVFVYVQDNVSWGLGFGLCIAVNAIAAAILLVGARYYRRPAAEGSPFTGLAQVVIAAIKKRKIAVAPEGLDYYYGTGSESVKPSSLPPTQSLRFLNRAALIVEGDTNGDGAIAKPWSLCTVEQVQDLKTLISISPLWTTAVLVSISIGIQGSLTVLQALTMDRSLGPHFAIPAGSLLVSTLAAVIISLALIDRLLLPLWHRLTGHALTPLQRIGVGHVLNAASMAVSALVERRRASIVRAHQAAGRPGWIVPMSVLWLLLPLALTGAAEAMHFPGQVALYYQEFPESLKSTATGMIALLIAIGFYLSTAVIDLVRRLTGWLPDNINDSRLDNVYWMLAVVGAINFGYYVLCARLYKYKVNNIATAKSRSVG